MRKQDFNLTLSLLLTLGGCSQIIGLSDYDIDSKLGAAGEASTDGGDGGGGKTTTGGKNGDAGTNNTPGGDTSMPQGGDQNMPQGGDQNMPQGGEAPVGGSDGAGGAPPLGALIPCDSAECCTLKGGKAVALEMLGDGGFELGTAAEGNTPWIEDSALDYALITDGVDEMATPHKGTYFAFLAGVKSETSDLTSERLKIPADAGWIVLSGYRYFQLDSAKTDVMNEDFMGIGLYDYAVTDPQWLPFFWDNSDPGATPTWTKFEASIAADDNAGTDRYLLFRGSTDAHVTDTDLASSNYMIDDVSLKVYRCYE